MKPIAFILSLGFAGLSFAMTAGALPVDLTGLWSFKGRVEGAFRIETVRLSVRTDADRAKLAEMKSAGFECVYVDTQIYRCKRISDLTTVTPEHLGRIHKHYDGRYLMIGAPLGPPTKLSEGDSVTRWSIPSPVRSANGATDAFEYWELTGLSKIRLDLGEVTTWLNIEPSLPPEPGPSLAEVYLIQRNSGATSTQFFYNVFYEAAPHPDHTGVFHPADTRGDTRLPQPSP